MSKSRFDVDDLPRFSPWPARLLGLEPWQQRCKTAQEVTREFEYEKWGTLRKKSQETGCAVSVDDVDGWCFEGSAAALGSINGHLEFITAKEAHERYLNLVEETLKKYLPASALIEFGCGYGSIILGLAKRAPFRDMQIIAGEFTANGLALVKQLAVAQGLNLKAGHCDFTAKRITNIDIPVGSVIFTSYATHYVPVLSTDFMAALSALRPNAIIHIEPCYEHCDEKSLIGLLRRRYIQINDYNTNLITLLHKTQELGSIEIVEECPAVFGSNPFLAASITVWRPKP